jgi:murein DD-endopeptidase MepM/ murein hydrolase activator NlpD
MMVPLPDSRIPRYGNGRFGVRRSPTHVHQGLDLAAPIGTPVRAAEHGVVRHVVAPGTKGFSGYGATVVIEHVVSVGKVWTLYAHLRKDSARVAVGDTVQRGQIIAEVGDTGGTVADPDKRIGGPHLHFEVSIHAYPQPSEQTRLDPTFFLTPW